MCTAENNSSPHQELEEQTESAALAEVFFEKSTEKILILQNILTFLSASFRK